MPFQVLTGQWSKIFTYKYRVNWADLANGGPSAGFVVLPDIPRAVEVIGVKIWLRETFAGDNMLDCQIALVSGIDLGLANAINQSYITFDLLQPATDYSGKITMGRDRINNNVIPPGNYISNQNAPNQLIVAVIRNVPYTAPKFSAGEFDIWIQTMKMP